MVDDGDRKPVDVEVDDDSESVESDITDPGTTAIRSESTTLEVVSGTTLSSEEETVVALEVVLVVGAVVDDVADVANAGDIAPDASTVEDGATNPCLCWCKLWFWWC